MHVGFITLTKKLQKTLSEYHDRANLICLQVAWFKDVCQTKPRGENTKNESKAAYREDWSFQVEGSNSQRSNRVYIFHSLKRNNFYVCLSSVIFGGFRIPPELNIFGSGEITKRICICVSTLNLLPLLKVKIWLDSSLVLFSGSGAQAS